MILSDRILCDITLHITMLGDFYHLHVILVRSVPCSLQRLLRTVYTYLWTTISDAHFITDRFGITTISVTTLLLLSSSVEVLR